MGVVGDMADGAVGMEVSVGMPAINAEKLVILPMPVLIGSKQAFSIAKLF